MKSFLLLALATMSIVSGYSQGGDKKPPVSPPATLNATLASGAVIKIDYSQPSVKGRTIGKDLEPMDGKVWRTGANDATVFETSKDITVNGKKLAAGKYGLFTLSGASEWTVIFNKTWKQWGAFKYAEADDALRVMAKATKSDKFTETMMFSYDKGNIMLWWGDKKVWFTVK